MPEQEQPPESACRKVQEEQIKKVTALIVDLKALKMRADVLRVTEVEIDKASDKIQAFWKDYEWQEWEPEGHVPGDALDNVLGEIDSAIDQYQAYLEEVTEELAVFEEEPFDDDDGEEDDEDDDSEDDEDDEEE